MTFNGNFDEGIRSALRQRRTALGLGCSEMAQKFGVSWSTYRKWELGPTARCNTKFAAKIEAFLNGHDDFESMRPFAYEAGFEDGDTLVNRTLTNLGLTCSLVSEMPELSRQMCSKLGYAFERAIASVFTMD